MGDWRMKKYKIVLYIEDKVDDFIRDDMERLIKDFEKQLYVKQKIVDWEIIEEN